MKEQIENLTKRLEVEINKTPSGDLRNILTDANVLLQALSIHDVSQQRELLIALLKYYENKPLTIGLEEPELLVDKFLAINCA